MRKLLSLILAFTLTPMIALGDNTSDPIIGGWYLVFDVALYPEIFDDDDDVDYEFGLCRFLPDGRIGGLTLDIKNDNYNTTDYAIGGRWSNNGDEYSVDLLGLGSVSAFFRDGDLYIGANEEISMKLRRMEEFNPYTDYIFANFQ